MQSVLPSHEKKCWKTLWIFMSVLDDHVHSCVSVGALRIGILATVLEEKPSTGVRSRLRACGAAYGRARRNLFVLK